MALTRSILAILQKDEVTRHNVGASPSEDRVP